MGLRLISKVIVVAALLGTAGCRNAAQRAPVLAEAYVGPATLNIRSDIPLDSAPVGVVKHGDRLEIIGRRRKFLKVRAPSGSEGWTDERQLLAASDMAELRELSGRAAKLPSQGVAASYRDLNVHTEPVPGSPSFLRLKEGEKFDVVAELVAPRTEAARTPLIRPPEKKKPVPKKPKKEPKIPPPPLPAPPPLPSNWLELSKTEREEVEGPAPVETKPPIPTDYWSLIRTPSGQSGWVLTRLIYMAIPDEVAQYAEGARIVSYHSLGYVQDEDKKKAIWLWTTVRGRQSYDFDSFRVFVWSTKRHRYETAYIDRNTRGYWPVLVNDVSYAKGGESSKVPGFSVCVENKEGQKVRREYAMLGNVVRYAGESVCELPAPVWVAKAAASPAQSVPESTAAPKEGVLERMKRWFRRSPKK